MEAIPLALEVSADSVHSHAAIRKLLKEKGSEFITLMTAFFGGGGRTPTPKHSSLSYGQLAALYSLKGFN